MKREINPMLLKNIVDKLIGDINPAGATHLDEVRKENLEVYIGLTSLLIWELYDIADGKNDYRASVSSMGQEAYDFLKNEHDIFKDTFEREELEE